MTRPAMTCPNAPPVSFDLFCFLALTPDGITLVPQLKQVPMFESTGVLQLGHLTIAIINSIDLLKYIVMNYRVHLGQRLYPTSGLFDWYLRIYSTSFCESSASEDRKSTR